MVGWLSPNVVAPLVRRIGFAVLALVLITACQTTAGGPPRDKWVKMPKDLLRLQVDGGFYGDTIRSLGSEAEAAWGTGKGSQRYIERLTFSGPSYVMSLHLRMLPKGWYWTVPESVVGLQDDLQSLYGWTLGNDITMDGINVVRTGFSRSFFARFKSKGRDCAGIMLASRVGVVSNQFRNTIVGYLCTAVSGVGSLKDETILEMLRAVQIVDPYYNGDGFSDEQIEFFKGKQGGVVRVRPGPIQGAG